jgi:molybdate transport system substrate-binding protein
MKVPCLTLALALAMVVAACSSAGSTTSPSASGERSAASSAATPPSAPSAPSAEAAELTIFAAASLKHMLAEAESAYEAANPGTDLWISTDSSSALETKIEQGAPADVFLSADTTNPQKLIDGGFASGEAVRFAGNKLTVIVPTDNPAAIQSAADLAKPGLRIIAAGDDVPITKYAIQLVENLAAEADDPAGFADAYVANVASKEDNVSSIVSKVALGEGDAGIVYVTDAAASDEVTAIAVPDAANVPATYAGVVVRESPNHEAAAAFLDWLTGADGQAVLSSFGFLPPP